MRVVSKEKVRFEATEGDIQIRYSAQAGSKWNAFHEPDVNPNLPWRVCHRFLNVRMSEERFYTLFSRENASADTATPTEEEKKPAEDYRFSLSIDILSLQPRVRYALNRAGIMTLGDICRHKDELTLIRGVGQQSADVILKALEEYGI